MIYAVTVQRRRPRSWPRTTRGRPGRRARRRGRARGSRVVDSGEGSHRICMCEEPLRVKPAVGSSELSACSQRPDFYKPRPCPGGGTSGTVLRASEHGRKWRALPCFGGRHADSRCSVAAGTKIRLTRQNSPVTSPRTSSPPPPRPRPDPRASGPIDTWSKGRSMSRTSSANATSAFL